jgi:large repetitive protein
MSIVRSRHLPAHPLHGRPLASAVQLLAIGGAFLLGILLALSLPGTARGADPSPSGGADSYDAPHAGILVVDAADGVLANDAGLDLVAELWNDADHGTVTLAPDGSFTYAPSEPSEADQFAYLAIDADGVATGPVKVQLSIENFPPQCDAVQLRDQPAGEVVSVDLRDVCTDADGDPMVFEYQRPDVPPGAAWDANLHGVVSFLAPEGWSGTGTVMFTASDGYSTSMPSLLAIEIVPAE